MIRTYTVFDVLIILVMTAGVFLTFNLLKSGRPDSVVVFRQNTIIAEYPLLPDAVFTVNGKVGVVNIEIKNGAVRIAHANCPRKICRQSSGIRNSYGQLVCAPNNILVRIRSSKNGSDVDAVAY